MRKRSIKDAPWYPHAVAACIAVVLYIVLSRFDSVIKCIGAFVGFFRPVIFGCILAYIINPLSRWFNKKVFRKIKTDTRRDIISNLTTFIVVIAFLVFSMMVLIPQLIDSVQTFSKNFDGYVASLNDVMGRISIAGHRLDIESLMGSSQDIMNAVFEFLGDNMNNILDISANAGKSVAHWLIAFVLSIYLLAEKKKIKAAASRLLRAVFRKDVYDEVCVFLRKCDDIFNRYIVFNLIDSFIIGIMNAIFMNILGMEYSGLVSFVVGITNLIPTVGPAIGAVIGAFVLFMVHPSHALIFLIFTLIVQIIDAYMLKPRLFGNTFGVSGLLLLIGVIVGGSMFGVPGVLLSFPGVAILDMIYNTYLLPWLEKRRG
ncbi:MAG: AI-2E family transporter [Lachnospiraceae bacterium]|nr:AI-2E family transporter [Lachnospiraceae bacterium]